MKRWTSARSPTPGWKEEWTSKGETQTLKWTKNIHSNRNLDCKHPRRSGVEFEETQTQTVSKTPRKPGRPELCWFSVVAGVTGLIRGICAVKTVKIENVICYRFYRGGAPFVSLPFSPRKNRTFYVFF